MYLWIITFRDSSLHYKFQRFFNYVKYVYPKLTIHQKINYKSKLDINIPK